jgi:hypothetical protein
VCVCVCVYVCVYVCLCMHTHTYTHTHTHTYTYIYIYLTVVQKLLCTGGAVQSEHMCGGASFFCNEDRIVFPIY